MDNDRSLKLTRLWVIFLIAAAIAAILGDGFLCGIVVLVMVIALGEMMRVEWVK